MMKALLAVALTAVWLIAPAHAAEIGDDGLHKEPWFRITFKDMTEDLKAAQAEDKRLMLIFEQRGCIYCRKMHEEVFSDPKIKALIEDKFFVVQMNLFGDEEVTDFDGTALSEKKMAGRWGVVFTPTIMFMPDSVPDSGSAAQAAVSIMPGAFGKGTTLDMLTWVLTKGYEGDEHFQKYHAREIERRASEASQ